MLKIGAAMAARETVKLKLKKNSLWIDPRTHKTLSDLCGAVVMASWGADGPLFWSRLQEIVLERRFGVQLSNSKT